MTSDLIESHTGKNQYRIAIAGCGPRGLYALSDLLTVWSQSTERPKLIVHIFEPCQFPGAGNVYCPSQPDYLRMNFSADKIDAWRNPRTLDFEQPTFLEWLQKYGSKESPITRYASRKVVGQYLHWCYHQTVNNAPKEIKINLQPSRVTSVTQIGREWCINCEETQEFFDEVLLTVGHGGWRPSPFHGHEKIERARIVTEVFPTHQHLSREHIFAGERVAIRGFALTAIDAMLALTEGRGGQFQQKARGHYQYIPSGEEPAKIFPYSRSGRPMLAKPETPLFPSSLPSHEHWLDLCHQLKSDVKTSRSNSRYSRMRDFIFTTAQNLLNDAIGSTHITSQSSQNVMEWWENWITRTGDEKQVFQQLETSFLIAIGSLSVDEGWAIGETWRQLYPAFVDTISHDGLEENCWKEFQRDAVEMERIAFGPPAENIGRILALIDAGVVDISLVGSGSQIDGNDMDVIVNAVLPSPTCFGRGSVISQLLEDDILQTSSTGAVQINRAGYAVGYDGTEVNGLAVLGRATEGCVLGNDTLSRKLHHHSALWAEGVVEQAVETVCTPSSPEH